MTPEIVSESPTLSAIRAARVRPGRRTARQLAPGGPDCVVGYLRVSSEEQAASGLGLAAQEAAIREECKRRGLTLCAVYADPAVSGTTPPDLRPGLSAAISALDAGEASILMVAKLDRLARNLGMLTMLTPLAERAGWSIVVLNCPFDMTTATGKLMANVMGAFAEMERDLIAERTKAALAVRRAEGVQLGKPTLVTDEARRRIVELREEKLSWRAIADRLNVEGVPSGSGRVAWIHTAARRHCPQENR